MVCGSRLWALSLPRPGSRQDGWLYKDRPPLKPTKANPQRPVFRGSSRNEVRMLPGECARRRRVG
jgi:hypothetical protein